MAVTQQTLANIERYAQVVREDIEKARGIGFAPSDELKEVWASVKQTTAERDFESAGQLLGKARALTWVPVTNYVNEEIGKLRARNSETFFPEVEELISTIENFLRSKNSYTAWQRLQEAWAIFESATSEQLARAEQKALERIAQAFGDI